MLKEDRDIKRKKKKERKKLKNIEEMKKERKNWTKETERLRETIG